MKTDRTIHPASPNEKSEWNTYTDHPLQSWEWGDFRSAMGIDCVRLGIYEGNSLIHGWQVTFHPIPYTPRTVGYFPKGPKPTKEMIEELQKIGKQKHAVYIQLEPNVTKETSTIDIQQLFPSHHPLFTKYTFVLDLTKSEDALLAAMHPKTRYNIKIAQKHNVLVKEDSSDNAFNEFLRLSDETTKRQGFFAHNAQYTQTMWRIMSKSGIAKLFTASVDSEVVVAWILFVWKDTVYYPYGASGRNRREAMAPNLLLWEIVKWAKAKGYKKFDLWGALGPNPDENDPWYGFHRFKQGYNPALVEFVGSYDLIINPILYKLYCLADIIRWSILRLIKR